MKIEIIEFFPMEYQKEKGILTGTLRIRLSDVGIHIMGIFVNKNKDHWFFVLPGQKGIHHQTGEIVRYPYVAFEEKEQQAQLINAIRQHAPAFIEKRLADTEKPLVWSQKQKIEDNKRRTSEKKDYTIEVKQTGNEVGRIVPSIANKVWHDPPPRKNMRKNCTYGKYR